MEFISTEMDGKVTVTTTTALSGTVGQSPTAGVLQISGANGSTATVDAGACSDSEFELTVNGTNEGCKSWNCRGEPIIGAASGSPRFQWRYQ